MDVEDGVPQDWDDLSAEDREAVFRAYSAGTGRNRIAAIRELRDRHDLGLAAAKRIVEEGLASDDWQSFRIRHAIAWEGMPRLWLQ